MADEQRLNVRVLVEITDAGGKPWYNADNTWANVPQSIVVEMEQVLANASASLVAMGRKFAQDKKAK